MSESITTSSVVQEAISHLAQGGLSIVMDDSAPTPWGVLMCDSAHATESAVNALCIHARGLVCVTVRPTVADRLRLEPQNDVGVGLVYLTSVEARVGVTTGISAADRAATIAVCIDDTAGPDDLVAPGHLFPVRVENNGVLSKRSVAEAVADLATLTSPSIGSGVFCHILDEDGREAGPRALRRLAKNLEVPIVTVRELLRYRTVTERLVEPLESGQLQTKWGTFDMSIWEDQLADTDHLLASIGLPEPGPDAPAPLVRVHSQCLTGDSFHSHRCDCGFQLDEALQRISEEGCGALLYLRQEGRGIGLVAKLRAYALQERGRDTVEANLELGFDADVREYGIAAQILKEAGYSRLRLMTNNPRKINALRDYGIDVVERVAIQTPPIEGNARYLQAKKDKLGHLLELD
ncbi:MAG: GTP cyclohydrolase II [Myxococcota bacterium]|nr:GTP cyclohydrolase II [Myxococcota bacterium]